MYIHRCPTVYFIRLILVSIRIAIMQNICVKMKTDRALSLSPSLSLPLSLPLSLYLSLSLSLSLSPSLSFSNTYTLVEMTNEKKGVSNYVLPI